MKILTKILERWIIFVKIILDPWLIILSIVLVVLISAVVHAEKVTLQPFILILVSLLSGLLGAIFIRKWIDLNEEKPIIVRGEHAIKNLKLIYFNVQRTEKRIKLYIKKLNEENLNLDLIKLQFEEIVEKCTMVEEECINAISLWSDIIDKADAKNILLNMFTLKEKELNLKKSINQLKKEFKENPSEFRMDIETFEKQLDQKEFEIKELTQQILKKEDEINHSILSGMAGTAFYKDANTSFTDFQSQEN